MRFQSQLRSFALLRSLTTLLVTLVAFSAASPSPKESWNQLRGLSWPDLFARGSSCSGTTCGWSGQLCCSADEACITDSSDQAQCTKTTAAVTTATGSGYWQYYTTVYTQTDLVTVTSTYSSAWCASSAAASTTWAAATSTASVSCDYTLNETPCGDICCASGQYCYTSGQCKAAAGSGSSGYYSSYYTSSGSASAALRPTSSTVVVVTATSSPTTTVPYVPPVATGATVSITGASTQNSHGLSGGAIAGIVIGVLLGIFLLILLCLFCCFRSIWVALFGRGRRRTEHEEYYESHRHRSGSGGAAAAGGRNWYGSRPARVETRRERRSSGLKEGVGIAAGLAGLAALLGMKRKHDRRREEEKSDLSSDYYSGYYTSESSASSDDRYTRRSSRTRR